MPELAPPQQTDEFLHLPDRLLPLATLWSKSNVIRLIVGGVPFGSTSVRDQLEAGNYNILGDDIKAAVEVGHQLSDETRPSINPGDSRTLRIEAEFLDMLQYSEDPKLRPRKFVLSPMQKRRYTPVPKDLPRWALEDMLFLEDGTTQWASAAILLQDRFDEARELIPDIRPNKRLMLEKSKSARARILGARALGKAVLLDERDYDMTFLRQDQAFYTSVVTGEAIRFEPLHSEDVYDAIFTGTITPKQAVKLFPQITRHEVNRYEEAIRLLNGDRKRPLNTEDHRAAMAAIKYLGYTKWTKTTVKAINKTRPQFFEMREATLDSAA